MDSLTLLREALILPETERLQLVERLLETLPADGEQSDEAFRAELERRCAEVDAGTAELIHWEQLKAERE